MNKSAVKSFAVRARTKLIEDITQKAYELGITKNEVKDIETFEGGFKIKGLENSKTFKRYEANQREKLISNVKIKGLDQVIEEVAYTWFNRFIAIRFMEVNEYLPTGVRVLSSIEEGKTEPDIIKEALNIDLDIEKEIVYRLIDANDTEDLYKYLLIKQCNELGKIMPMVFEEIADYTELLMPDNLLSEGSVIRDLVQSIDEEDYKEQVEIIGWMYQYYISEKKDEVFADLKKNVKITKENIPAATQLFTPKWIVKYMVENSLGRLWLESHPNEELQSQWKYYLEEAEQDPEVQQKLDELKDPNLNPENIKVLDPSMGSGHILVYAFDVLYDIYLKANYSERDIPQLILEKNLYGLDIDDRAGQLAAFALMMKGRSKNRRIFRKKIELNVCSIGESNGIPKEAIDYLVSPKETAIEKSIHRSDVEYIIEVFHDAKEYGSILDVKKIDFDAIENRLEEIRTGETIDFFELQYKEDILEKLPSLIKQGRTMSEKYDVVCTNPPYLGRNGMNSNLVSYLDKYFSDSKTDLYAAFLYRVRSYTDKNKFIAMITQHSWMFISSLRKLRQLVLNKTQIQSMVHLGTRAFEEISGEVVQTTTFVLKNHALLEFKPKFIKLVDINNSNLKEKKFFEREHIYGSMRQEDFFDIPNIPIAYWLSKNIRLIFNNKKLEEMSISDGQTKTGNNDKYLRNIWEIDKQKIGIGNKWVIHEKAGTNRKWACEKNIIIDWSEEARIHYRKNKVARIAPEYIWFRQGISWNLIATRDMFPVRLLEEDSTFNLAAPSIFMKDIENTYYILGFLNTKITNLIIKSFNPTINTNISDVLNIPIIICDKEIKSKIELFVKECISITKENIKSFETSFNFTKHPLIRNLNFKGFNVIETAFNRWTDFTNEQFEQLKANEEELNRIFIDIYGLQDELTLEVEDKDITISKADRLKDIKSFISYAIGCMFGRYSLDEEGLIFAGGEFDINRYKTFVPTKDNVLVIADDDYFEDDIVNRFVDFVKITFGADTLEDNLDYIAETLDKKANETSRQAIRRYFLKDFYTDHVKKYSKRPIYWLVDSGKQNGFKALIYMQRYDSSTIARVRTDYLHKLQKMYESEVNRLDILIDSDLSAREKAAAIKKKDNINKQIQECRTFDQVIAHVANQKIYIDLDDGVVVNYDKFQGVEIPQGEGKKALEANLLAKI